MMPFSLMGGTIFKVTVIAVSESALGVMSSGEASGAEGERAGRKGGLREG